MMDALGILLIVGALGLLFFAHKLPEKTLSGIHKVFVWLLCLGLVALVLGTCMQSVGRRQDSPFERQYR